MDIFEKYIKSTELDVKEVESALNALMEDRKALPELIRKNIIEELKNNFPDNFEKIQQENGEKISNIERLILSKYRKIIDMEISRLQLLKENLLRVS